MKTSSGLRAAFLLLPLITHSARAREGREKKCVSFTFCLDAVVNVMHNSPIDPRRSAWRWSRKMGLLYVSGVPFHDEDQELIERRREKRTNSVRLQAREDASDNAWTQRELLEALSKARVDQSEK